MFDPEIARDYAGNASVSESVLRTFVRKGADEVEALAKENERLREALEEIADVLDGDPEMTLRYVIDHAKKALGSEDA